MDDIDDELGGNGASEEDGLEDAAGMRDFLSDAKKLLIYSNNKCLHHEYMARAVELAKKSQPDDGGPYVGAVLVKDCKIIADAYKVREPWQPGRKVYCVADLHLCHAEEKAIEIAGSDVQGATLYVTLEPCTGRNAKGRNRPSGTPCVELITQAGIKTVVVGVLDSINSKVSGRGVIALVNSGIEVVLYNAGLSEQLLRLIKLGQMRRKSKAKEYLPERLKYLDNKGAYVRPNKLPDVHDGNKRESNRLRKIINAGLKEYEEDNTENNFT